jgi:hypothetical protein
MLRMALAVLVRGAVRPAQTQSLEETYANLCVDKSAKQGETCAALRKAMLDKLNAEQGNTLPAGAARTPGAAGAAPVVTPVATFPPWGALDKLPGTAWSGPNGEGILRYRWEQPGRVMVEEWMDKTQMRETRFVLAPAGSTASARYAFRIQPDAPDDAPIAIVHALDPTTATVAYSTGPMSREIEADGSIRTDVNTDGAVIRTRIALAGPDAYDWAFGEVRSGKYKSFQKLRFEREGAGKRGSGGMLGTIIGASVGVAAAGRPPRRRAAPSEERAATRPGPTLRRVRVPASPSPITASARSRAAATLSSTRCTSGRSRRAIRKPTPIAPMPRMKIRRASRRAFSAATARTETRSRDG